MSYRGRFAPSPTGPLHFGSIVAALASYLQARHHQGQWLIRIEDIDTPRVQDGAETTILSQLEQLGLKSDSDISRQSDCLAYYQHALDALIEDDMLYACRCSRKKVGAGPYPGYCREAKHRYEQNTSIRLKVSPEPIVFQDKVQQLFSQSLEQDVGDFIVKRSDGLFAYHLAVVVDDVRHGITEIVRGADLLDSTPRQIYLQQCLSLSTPEYIHIPVATDKTGRKLSKSDQDDIAINHRPVEILLFALRFLGQDLPPQMLRGNPESVLSWAIEHWDIESVPKQTSQHIQA